MKDAVYFLGFPMFNVLVFIIALHISVTDLLKIQCRKLKLFSRQQLF